MSGASHLTTIHKFSDKENGTGSMIQSHAAKKTDVYLRYKTGLSIFGKKDVQRQKKVAITVPKREFYNIKL